MEPMEVKRLPSARTSHQSKYCWILYRSRRSTHTKASGALLSGGYCRLTISFLRTNGDVDPLDQLRAALSTRVPFCIGAGHWIFGRVELRFSRRNKSAQF